MARKKRAPIEKLREVKEFADDYLISRGMQLPHEQSALARIFSTDNGPILPGVPAYLPYPWTINTTRRVLYDLTREWQLSTSNDSTKAESDITHFFRFVIKGLEDKDSEIRDRMQFSIKTQQYDLKLFHKKHAVEGIAKFLVDSFAVAVVEKSIADVPEYLEWFMRWTDSLLLQWGQNIREIDGKRNEQGIQNTR